MEQTYYIREGAFDEVTSRILVMRGRTQFWITVCFARVLHTRVGRDYLQQIQRRLQYTYDKPRTFIEPSDILCLYCLPLLENLAPQTSVRDLTLEDFLYSPTYNLELIDTGNNGEARVEGGETCLYTPSYDIKPMLIADLPKAYKAIARCQASSVLIAPSEEDLNPLRSVQGRVKTAEGIYKYFKPRTAGRETEFDRELQLLGRIKEAGLGNGQYRLPILDSLVVSGERGETVIGMLMDLIVSPRIGSHLMSPGFWGQHDLHKKWEEQVNATVELLHTYGIVWGDVNPCNVAIDEALDAWVIDFGGMNNAEFVDDDKAETVEGDWQGVTRLFKDWLPSRVV